MPLLKLSNSDLAAALIGYEFERDRISAKIAEIRRILDGGSPQTAVSAETRKPRKKRSAAVRRKMALAQRARYAKLKEGSEPAQTATAKPKRKLSAAGKRNIIEGTKRRWAAVRAAKEAEAAKTAPSSKGPRKAAKKAVASKAKKAAKAPQKAEAQAAG